MFEHRAFTMVLAPFFLFYIGLLGLALIILFRSRVQKWIGILIILGMIIELGSPIPIKARIFFALLSLSFAALGWKIFSTDASVSDHSSTGREQMIS